MSKKYQAFKGLNLNGARSENETREEYKLRKKRNNKFLELYDRLGREQFQQMFPDGVSYDMFEAPKEEIPEYSKEEMKEKIEEYKKNAKRFGEAK